MTTYTPISRLPIMTPADPAVKDSWGLILNAALPCIEQTAAGIATISLTGLNSYTLSVANDAPDQARQAMLLFTGQPSAACTVTIPSVARIGWVSNQANQNVILATATATTNLTVPPGASFLYTCDGAAVASVAIGGVGVLNANGGVQIGNGNAYAGTDTAGVQRNLLSIGTDNWTNLYMGGVSGWRVLNQAGTSTLFSLLPNGGAAFAGSLNIGGPLTVAGTFSPVGNTALTTLAVSATSTFTGTDTHQAGIIASTGYDAGGMQMRFVNGNYGAGWRQDGTNMYLMLTASGAPLGTYNTLRPFWVTLATGAVNLDLTGAGTTAYGALNVLGTVSTSAVRLTSGNVFLPNNAYLYAKDNSGTDRPCIGLGPDNNVNAFNAGGASWRVLNQSGSNAWLSIDNSGNATFAGPAVTINQNLTVNGTTTMPSGQLNAQAITCTSMAATGNVGGAGGLFTNVLTSGNTSTSTLSVSSTSTFTGAITANGSSSVSGNGAFVNAAGHQFGSWTVGCGLITPNALAGQGFYATSDARLKSDITDLSPAQGYDWINRARPRRYVMDGRRAVGFVAQEEVERGRAEAVVAIPDERAIFAQSDGYAPEGARLARHYEHDIAYLTAALQGALARITALEAQLAAS